MQLSKEHAAVISKISTAKILPIKAGLEDHRFLNIWSVVVDNRIYIRSWGLAKSWYNVFLKTPIGLILLDGVSVPIHIRKISDSKLNEAISKAYLQKYSEKTLHAYAIDMTRSDSVNTTLEVILDGDRQHS